MYKQKTLIEKCEGIINICLEIFSADIIKEMML